MKRVDEDSAKKNGRLTGDKEMASQIQRSKNGDEKTQTRYAPTTWRQKMASKNSNEEMQIKYLQRTNRKKDTAMSKRQQRYCDE